MELTCTSCNSTFTADAGQEAFVLASRAKNMPMAMLECGRCGLYFPLDLKADRASEAITEEASPLRCPVLTCAGYATAIGDVTDAAYGCGECGTTWDSAAELERSIKSVVKKRPYRAAVYRMDGGPIVAVALADEPDDYDDKVRTEWADRL